MRFCPLRRQPISRCPQERPGRSRSLPGLCALSLVLPSRGIPTIPSARGADGLFASCGDVLCPRLLQHVLRARDLFRRIAMDREQDSALLDTSLVPLSLVFRNAHADQGSYQTADRELTQKIRRELMRDKALSSYAHNVKVVTQGGQVTLKGPVRSEAEKQSVESKAVEVAGAEHVTNQMSVAPPHTKASKR